MLPTVIDDAAMPNVEELGRMFTAATGETETISARDKALLLVWEKRVRPLITAKLRGVPVAHRFTVQEMERPKGGATAVIGLYESGQVGEIQMQLPEDAPTCLQKFFTCVLRSLGSGGQDAG